MKAPIILFVYNRPWHTEQTLNALSENDLANDSILYIYADGAKPESTDEQLEEIKQVRDLIRSKQWCKEVHIVESDKNKGLADSIISGITDIINQYGKVIVLEDDIVTSPWFLKYMNNALDYFVDAKKVWHISGWNYPIDPRGLPEAFFWCTMNCWGWATWKDRWRYFEKNIDKLTENFTRKDIYRFNINNTSDHWNQIILNKSNEINTWAIFWYVVVFKNNGLCLNPATSFTKNIGLDATGVNCSDDTSLQTDIICEKEIELDQILLEENKTALKRIMRFYKKRNKRSYRIILKDFIKKYFILKIFYLIYKKIRHLLSKALSLKYTNRKKTSKLKIKCQYKWYGNNYGGFFICPDMLISAFKKDQERIIYSAGVGEDISFDQALLEEFHCKIFAFDPTPKSINWIQQQKIPNGFLFFPYGIGDKTEKKPFYLPKNETHVSGSIFTHENISLENTIFVQMKSLEDIAKEHQHTYIDILKMDIEGSEFALIENFPKNIVFGQIAIEFHERFLPTEKFLLRKSLKILKQNGYYCFAVSEHGDEYSFINKNEYKKISRKKKKLEFK